jgi:hypothetical protein
MTRRQMVDFDLHGLAGIRLVDATDRDVAAVGRQLGPLPRRLEREPDIVIRFVDRIELGSRMRYLGAHDAGFTDDAFFVLKSRKEPVVLRIPMAGIGGPVELLCEHGPPAVPFLIAIVNLTVLGNGALPLHAAAFELDGVGVLVTGWSKGGKTEVLMGAAAAGARYIGDEWVYLTTDGRMHGIPEPIRLWDWHLDQLPDVRRRLGFGARSRLAALGLTTRLIRAVPRALRRLPPVRLARRALPVLEGQLHVDVPPERLFDDLRNQTGRLDHVVLVESAAGPGIEVRSVDPGEVAHRMVASLLYERQDLIALSLQARFAFPDLEIPGLATFEARQRDLLERCLAGRPAHVVTHPYPVDIRALFDAVRPLIG